MSRYAEIITLRAIALKQLPGRGMITHVISRDHNATSYSTETYFLLAVLALLATQRS